MTIEERAEQSSIEQLGRLSPAFECGYIQGATDQKRIDIDKAVRWLETQNLTRGRYDFIEEFKKAME